jgi:hypothetical protein
VFRPNQDKSETAEPRRHFEKDGGFSFVLPEDWEVKDVPGEQFKVVVANDFRHSHMVLQLFPAIGDLNSFVSDTQKDASAELEESRVRKEEDFVTSSGLKGVRLRIESKADHPDAVSDTEVYLFSTGEVHYRILCRGWDYERESDHGFDADYEQVMKTFRFEQEWDAHDFRKAVNNLHMKFPFFRKEAEQ